MLRCDISVMRTFTRYLATRRTRILHSVRSKGFCSTSNAIREPDEKITELFVLCKSSYGSSLFSCSFADKKEFFLCSKINKFYFSDSFLFCLYLFLTLASRLLPSCAVLRLTVTCAVCTFCAIRFLPFISPKNVHFKCVLSRSQRS